MEAEELGESFKRLSVGIERACAVERLLLSIFVAADCWRSTYLGLPGREIEWTLSS